MHEVVLNGDEYSDDEGVGGQGVGQAADHGRLAHEAVQTADPLQVVEPLKEGTRGNGSIDLRQKALAKLYEVK